mmetsp:Transcript_6855/g.16698  ORF Transcript_6855/g.16698 Transcript_6855/m.16698 type:complete len:97 (+) Transcript_6855:414-704(+)
MTYSAQPGDAEADAARVAWARKALVPAVSRLSWAAVLKRIVDLSLREATDGGPQLGCTALQNMANRLLVHGKPCYPTDRSESAALIFKIRLDYLFN